MPVIVKSPGAPLYAEKLPGGGYELLQAFSGSEGAGVRAHVMEAPHTAPGNPGVWTAPEIGPEGPYGRERYINRNLTAEIGPEGRTGKMGRANLYLTKPIKAFGDVEQAAINPLPPPSRWALAAVGAAVGFLGLRWLLKRRKSVRNPAWTSEESRLGGQWSIWTLEGEFIGYVLRMQDGFAALTDKGAVIGKLKTRIEAEALVYGNWSYRFGNYDTLVGNPKQKPWFTHQWPQDKAAFETHDVLVRGYGPIGWVYTPSEGVWIPFLELEGQRAEGVIAWPAETLEEASEATYDKFMAEHASKLPSAEPAEPAPRRPKRLPREEIEKRIFINLSRQKRQSRTYALSPKVVQAGHDQSGHPYHTSISRDLTMAFQKSVSEDRLTRMVKAPKSSVLRLAKEMARARKIYGYCHRVPIYAPVVKQDPSGRKVITAKRVARKNRLECHFALHGPGGELGLFKAGEHKVPEGIKARLHKGDAVRMKGSDQKEPWYIGDFSFDFEGQLQAYVQPFRPFMTPPAATDPGEWVRIDRLDLVKVANPEQTSFRFEPGPSYIVRERKPKGRGRDGRMFYEKWTTISMHDTLASAKKAATVHCPEGHSRRWLRQRAIFLRDKRVSNGPFLLREFEDLPERPE
jgi:hypothetical protein